MVDVLVAFRQHRAGSVGPGAARQLARAHHPHLQPGRAHGPRPGPDVTSAHRHADAAAARPARARRCSPTTRRSTGAPSSGRCSSWPTATTSATPSPRTGSRSGSCAPALHVGAGRRPAAAPVAARRRTSRAAPRDDNRLEVGSEFYYVRRRFGFRGAGPRRATSSGRPRAACGWSPGASLLVDDERLPSRIGVAKQPIEGAQAGEVHRRHLASTRGARPSSTPAPTCRAPGTSVRRAWG